MPFLSAKSVFGFAEKATFLKEKDFLKIRYKICGMCFSQNLDDIVQIDLS